MKIISIVGTRPQFLKMIPLSIQFEKISNIESVIIHSGQHYDNNMSSDLFNSLDIKMPKYILKRIYSDNLVLRIEKVKVFNPNDYANLEDLHYQLCLFYSA